MTKGIIIQLLIGLLIGGALGALMGHFGKCSSGGCPLTANPYRGALYGMFMGAMLAYSLGMRKIPQKADTTTETAALIHVDSSADFERVVLATELPVLADFFSNSCPPCRRLSPTISELAAEYEGRAVICKVNVDLAPELARKYAIRGIPAVLFFMKGEEATRVVGLRSKASYVKEIDKLLPKETKEN